MYSYGIFEEVRNTAQQMHSTAAIQAIVIKVPIIIDFINKLLSSDKLIKKITSE